MLDSLRLIPVVLASETGHIHANVNAEQAMALCMISARGELRNHLMNQALEIQAALLMLGWRP